MTRVVVALDSFKGTIAAAHAVAALAAGWREVDPRAELDARPMADGGEGTLAAFAAAVPGAVRVPVRVTGPAGTPVAASWLRLPSSGAGSGAGAGAAGRSHGAAGATGVVELAGTSGIELLGDRRLPMDAGTAGFGQAIAAALDAGVERLILGIGSSASTDGGAGMLAALDARIRDDAGAPIGPGARGLATVAAVDLSGIRPLPPGGVTVLSDVASPLTGPAGAAAVFGPQKGLDAAGVAAADAALARFARLVPADPDAPGAGAAGGTGFGLLAWGARIRPGAREIAELIGLRDAIAGADLVITGEGAFDAQSAVGKVPALVAELAAAAGVPVALVAGRIAPDADVSGFAASVSLGPLAGSAAASIAAPERWLRAAGARLAGAR